MKMRTMPPIVLNVYSMPRSNRFRAKMMPAANVACIATDSATKKRMPKMSPIMWNLLSFPPALVLTPAIVDAMRFIIFVPLLDIRKNPLRTHVYARPG